MPRPKTKEELLQLSMANYARLLNLVESYPEAKQRGEFPKGYLNRSIKDVLAHLHHWHLMMLEWYEIGMTGDKPEMPAKGYTWKTLPDLNRKIQEQYQQTDYGEVRKLLDKSFEKIGQVIRQHSDLELFEKKRYKWTGTTSIGAYLISATSSHYDWAYKLIKKCMK